MTRRTIRALTTIYNLVRGEGVNLYKRSSSNTESHMEEY